jgi:hypothetical protein
MSLDVYLIENGEYVYDANITHNLGTMADAAGIYQALWRPEEIGAVYAKDITEIVKGGLMKMVCAPTEYKQYDSPNGWGMYDHFVPFISNYLEACIKHPNATIEISR